MGIRYLAAVCAAVVGFGGAAAQQPAEPEFSAERVKAHVSFLADDLLEGRDAGTRGYDLAARYVAAQYQALGLKPAGPSGWYQQVPFQATSLGAKAASLTIGQTRFANGTAVAIYPAAVEASQSVRAPVVFAGYGMYAPELGIDDYKGLDVKGKVVAVLSGFPKGMASDVGAHLASEKAKAAARHGATGVVGLLTPTMLKIFPWKDRIAYINVPTLNWTDAAGTPYLEAPEIRINAALDRAASEALFLGAPRSFASVVAESEKAGGRPKGFPLKQPILFERENEKKHFSSPNVLAVLPGSDPALANEYVLLMAHLDHDGRDEKLEGDQIYNGAMDNASGVATMLEAARALAASPKRPRRPILFAAVTAEEDGLLGAQYLARNPVTPGGKVVAVVNLDMPILTYSFEDVVAFGAEHSTLGPAVARAAAQDRVALSPDPDPAQGLFTRSDHYMFVREGVPSVFLVTGQAGPGKAATADFITNHYHRVSDDLKLPLNWEAGAKFARINYLIASEIANADRAPLWYRDSFFGKTFAAAQEKADRPK